MVWEVDCEEHLVGLHRGADEEAGERDHGQAQAACQVLVCEGVGIVVFCKHIEEASVDVGLHEVEFGDVGVFEPVY